MKGEKRILPLVEWEKIAWQKTPYKGVFIHKIEEEQDSTNPNIPKYTVMALKIEPGRSIPPHKHKRESNWTETITLPNGGWVETKNGQQSRQIRTKKLLTVVIKAGEIFGLKNMNPLQSLYFFSRMEPGFTGYREIEEIKTE